MQKILVAAQAQGLVAAALPTSSGTSCQPLRYSRQRRACKLAALKQQALKDPQALRSSGDDSKAAQRRPTLALERSSRIDTKSFGSRILTTSRQQRLVQRRRL